MENNTIKKENDASRIMYTIIAAIRPNWLIVLFYLWFLPSAKSFVEVAFIILPPLLYTIMFNLRRMNVIKGDLSFMITLFVFVPFIGLLVGLILMMITNRSVSFDNSAVAFSCLYAYFRVMASLPVDMRKRYSAWLFADFNQPDATGNYPVYLVCGGILQMVLQILVFGGCSLFIYGIFHPIAKFAYILIGAVLAIILFIPAFVPRKGLMEEIAAEAKAWNDDAARKKYLEEKTEGFIDDALERINGQPAYIDAGRYVAMTNDEAMRYFYSLYGDAETNEKMYEHFLRTRPEAAIETIADACSSGTMPSLEAVKAKAPIRISAISSPDRIKTHRFAQIKEYRNLINGKAGETAVYNILQRNFMKEGNFLLANVNLFDEDHTYEHDAILIADNGVFTFEVKNWFNRSVDIDADGTVVTNNTNDNDFISQNKAHVALLRDVLADIIPINAVTGAVVFTNPGTIIDNRSAYPVIRVEELVNFVDGNREFTLSDQQKRNVYDKLRSVTVSANKFLFTSVDTKYMHDLAADYNKILLRCEAVSEKEEAPWHPVVITDTIKADVDKTLNEYMKAA